MIKVQVSAAGHGVCWIDRRVGLHFFDQLFLTIEDFIVAKTKVHQDYGAEVSGPIFANLASQVAQALNLTPTEPVAPPAPAVAGPTLSSSTDTKTKWTP